MRAFTSRLAAVVAGVGLGLCAGPAVAAADAATSAATSAAPTALPVWALLDGDTPVARGRVRVYAGRLPATGSDRRPLALAGGARAARTNARGVALLRVRDLPRRFTVVVSSGRVDGRAMRGALSTQVSGYPAADGAIVYVNPVSTLVDAWRRVDPKVGTRRAERTIYRALGIPSWVDHADLRSNDRWVNAAVLLEHVRVHGSIDAVTKQLVIDVRRGKRDIRFTAAPQRRPATTRSVTARAAADDWWTTENVSSMVLGGLEHLGADLLGEFTGAGMHWALGQFLHAIGLDEVADFLMPQHVMLEQLKAIQEQLVDLRTLVETDVQATEHSDYGQKAARAAPIVADVKTLMEHLTYLASLDPTAPGREAYAATLAADIKQQLITNGFAESELDAQLRAPGPYAYGILQSASAYMGSRKPFFTEKSSAAVQAVFDSYQLVQLQMAILLTNYRLTQPGDSPAAINADVVEKIKANIEQQRALMKPPIPAGSFVDLRTGGTKPDMLLWGPSRWVAGATLEPSCTDAHGAATKFCDPAPEPGPAAGFATEEQMKGLVDGWEGETPLRWLEEHTGLPISRAPAGTPEAETGFVWLGPDAVYLHCANKLACDIPIDGNWYEWLHRFDLKDTSKPSPSGWSRHLFDLDAQNYAATAFDAPTAVPAGTYFWPVGG